jgi:hypothetical protein
MCVHARRGAPCSLSLFLSSTSLFRLAGLSVWVLRLRCACAKLWSFHSCCLRPIFRPCSVLRMSSREGGVCRESLLPPLFSSIVACLVCSAYLLCFLVCLRMCRVCPLPSHYTSLQHTALHYPALHFTTPHYTSLHFTTPHYTTLHNTTLHYTTLHYTALHHTTRLQVLCALDAELITCITLLFPPPYLLEDPDVLRASPSQLVPLEQPPLLRSGPLTPDPLLFLHAGLQSGTTLEAGVENVFPRPYPASSAQMRSLFVSSRRVLSRLVDAAVLVIARVVPFLSETQAQVGWGGFVACPTPTLYPYPVLFMAQRWRSSQFRDLEWCWFARAGAVLCVCVLSDSGTPANQVESTRTCATHTQHPPPTPTLPSRPSCT